MATELGSAFISVGLGTNTLAGDIKKAFAGAESSGSDAGKSAGGGFFKGFAGIATAAAGALGVGAFLKGAITSAGDLQQSAGAIGSVFKDSAGQMLAWSQTADSALGLTQNEFNELGTLIGSQLKNGGTAMDQLAPKTNELINLGADMSSMFGGTTREAIEALSSALRGETDPIERYGVSLSAARVEAKAAELGFKKVGGELSQEGKQAATLALIMGQTADAHGNFAKESETLAGQQQRMAAGWKDIQTQIGGLFLPVLTQAFGFINTSVLPVIDKFTAGLGDGGLAGAFGPLGGMIQSILPFFNAFAATWAPLIPTVLGLVSAFSPLQLIFGAVQPILGELAGLFQVLGLTLGTVLNTALTAVTPIVQTLTTALSGVFVAIMPTVIQMVTMLAEAMVTLAPVIAGVLAQVAPLVASLVSQLAPIITNLVTSILPPLTSIFGDIVTAIAPLITQIAGLLIPIIEALMPVVVTVFGVIADVIKSVMQIVQGVIQVVTGIISGDWDKVWTGIQNIFSGIWNTIVSVVKGALQIVGQVVMSGLGLIGGFVGDILGGIGRFFADTWNNITRGVGSFIDGFLGFFRDLPGKILGFMSGLGSSLFDLGRNMIQSLIDGAGSLLRNLGSFFLNLVPEFIREPFKQALGIHSPSRVFRSYGVNIGQGLILGVGDMQGSIESAVTGMVSVPAVPAFGAGSVASLAPSGAGSLFPDRLTLAVGDQEFTAYLSGHVRGQINQVASIAGGRSR